MRHMLTRQNTNQRWRAAFLAALAWAALPLPAQIARPQLGYVIDPPVAERPVIGIAGAASLRDPALDNAVGRASSFACTAKLCLAKTDDALIAFAPANAAGSPGSDSLMATPALPGPALIAIDDRV